MDVPTKNYAFIDGSFNPAKNIYGCGGFLVDQLGKKHYFKEYGDDQNMAKMRNVAGEILGAMRAIKLAMDLNMNDLTIFHDYEGIAAWPLKNWQCKKKETKNYALFVWKAIELGLNIHFSHVKAHNGIEGNEVADKLAKAAVELL